MVRGLLAPRPFRLLPDNADFTPACLSFVQLVSAAGSLSVLIKPQVLSMDPRKEDLFD
jgi:hypothetical protein